MLSTVRDILRLLSDAEKRRLRLLLFAVVIMGLFETIGVASIMPFLTILSAPEKVQENELLQAVSAAIGASSTSDLLFVMGAGALLLLILSNGVSALTTWFLLSWTQYLGHTISRRLLAGYLAKPYVFFLNRNSAELGKNILAEVNRVVQGVLVPGLQAVSKLVATVFILALLVVVSPKIALGAAVLFGGAYFSLYRIIRRKLADLGTQSVKSSRMRFMAATEAMTGIKDLKVLGREREYLARYSHASEIMARTLASSRVLGFIPKYAFEVVAFGGILVLTLYLLATGMELGAVVPFLGIYAFAGYRLMPAMQQIFAGLSSVRSNEASLRVLIADMAQVGDDTLPVQGEGGMNFCSTIELRDVVLQYPGAAEPSLRKVNLEIAKNTTVGFVGPTGSGKTTTVDVLLGLLQAQEGGLFVDGVRITRDNVRSWQRALGYVPQHIFLSDDTIARNIALGVAPAEIDHAAVRESAVLAQLDEFVQELPDGLDTVVGDRGVRLSGGQRQRIGIARALYHNPQVLVFDEATSALDTVTESQVMKAIEALAGKKTIILIAHRIATVASCDRIFFLRRGSLEASGTYEELLAKNEAFQRMVKGA